MAKKPSFRPDFVYFGPNLGSHFFFRGFYLYSMLDIVPKYHCIQFQGKLINQTCENGKKPSFGHDFGPFGPKFDPQKFFLWFLPLLDIIYCYKLSLYVMSRKTNEQNLRKAKMPKNLVSDPILVQNVAAKFLFSKIWLLQSLDIMVSYHHVQYQKKLIQSWQNLVPEGQTDGRQWFHRTLSD